MKTRLMEKYEMLGEEYNSSSEKSKLLFQSRDLLKKKKKNSNKKLIKSKFTTFLLTEETCSQSRQ